MKFLNAIGTEQFTPGQAYFRIHNAGGRFPADPTVNRYHTGFHVRTNTDGTVDLIRLEAGLNGWQDLGGKGAYDVRAGFC